MADIVCTTRIEASPQRVFSILADLPRAPEIFRSVLRLEVLGEEPLGIGTRFRETRSFFNREATESMTITTFDPSRRYAVACESHGARYLSRYEVREIEGGTEVEIRFEVQPRSWLGRLLTAIPRLTLAPVRRCAQADLEDLKRVAEAAEVP